MPTKTDTTTTPLDDSYDVVVVGARAAGAATAMRLARAGIRVAAIDKTGYGSDTLSTHSIAPAGVLLLSQWGVLDTVRAAGTPVGTNIAFHYGDDEVSFDVRPRGDVDGLYSPRRTVLDRALVDAAIDAGATVRHSTTVSGLVHDRQGRITGVDIDDGGQRRTISARIVVGADGMRSRVAGRAGAGLLCEEESASAVIYSYFDGVTDAHLLTNEFQPGHAAGVIPTNDGQTCVWVGVDHREFRSVIADGVDTAFARIVADSPATERRLAGAVRSAPFRSFPGQPGFLRHSWGDGWALVGDAAYFKDPVSAHGITDALIGAELLGDALITGIRTRDERPALTRYQEERNALAAPMISAVARAASFSGDVGEIAAAYMEMSAAMRAEYAHLEERFATVAAA